MNMLDRMCRFVAVCGMAVAPVLQAAAVSTYYWEKKSGSYDGVINDPAHWSLTEMPTVFANYAFSKDATFTVTAPAGGYEWIGNQTFYMSAGKTNTYDFTGSYLLQGYSADGGYGAAFNVTRFSSGAAVSILNVQADADGKSPVSILSNTVMRTTYDPGVRALDFTGGLVDFSRPDPAYAARTKGYLQTFRWSSTTEGMRIGFHHADSNLLGMYWEGNSPYNELLYEGGHHAIVSAGVNFCLARSVSDSSVVVTNIVRATNSAELDLTGVAVVFNQDMDSAKGPSVNIITAENDATVKLGPILSGCAYPGLLELSACENGRFVAPNLQTRGDNVNQRLKINLVSGSTFETADDWSIYDGCPGCERVRISLNKANWKGGTSSVFGKVGNPIGDNGIVLEAEDSDFDFSGGSFVNAGSQMTFRGCSLSAASMRIGVPAKKLSETTFAGGTVMVSGTAQLGTYEYAPSQYSASYTGTNVITFAKGVQAAFETGDVVKFGYNIPTRINVEDAGTLVQVKGLQMAWGGDSKYVELNLRGGTFKTTSDFIACVHSTSRISVEGGRLESPDILFRGTEAWFSMSAGEAVVPVFYLCNSSSSQRSHVELNGGCLTTYALSFGPGARACGGTGLSSLSANGGKIHLTAAANGKYLFSNGSSSANALDEAVLGPRGLTIESDNANVFITASFADKPDAVGEGRLILSGSGTKTLTGTDSRESFLDVADGTVVLADGASHLSTVIVTNNALFRFEGTSATVAGLVLGDAETSGRIAFDANQKLVVDGDAEIVNCRIELGTGFELGNVYDVLTVKGTIDAASRDAWSRALVNAGLPEGSSCSFVWAYDEGTGETTLQMDVHASTTTVISLDAGVSNATAAVTAGAGDALELRVASSADLTAGGEYVAGMLLKTGSGVARLTNAANQFAQGVELDGGRLEVSDPAALGGVPAMESDVFVHRCGTFAYSGPWSEFPLFGYRLAADAADKGLVVDTAGDLEIGNFSCDSGCLIKRGVGKLSLISESATTISKGLGKASTGGAPAPVRPVEFDDGDLQPTNGYGSISVAEGELKLRGTQPGATFTCASKAVPMVGLPLTAAPQATPRLTVENATLDATASANQGCYIHVGANCSRTVGATTEAVLSLTNATLRASTIAVGMGADSSFTGRIETVDSTLNLSYCIMAAWSASDVDMPFGAHRFVRSSVYAPWGFEFEGSADIVFDDHSVFAANSTLDKAQLEINRSYADIAIHVCGGSAFHMDKFDSRISTGASLLIEFDGGAWVPSADDFTFLFPRFTRGDGFVWKAVGDGVILSPGDSSVWRVETPLTGPGGFVKTGDGELVFGAAKYFDVAHSTTNAFDDTCSLKTEGVNTIRSGRVVVESGAASPRTRFAGSGTLSAAAIERPVLTVELDESLQTTEVLTLTDFTARGHVYVDLGRTEQSALDIGAGPIAVARYTGAIPDVSSWRVLNAGRKCRGRFVAAGGRISVTITEAPGIAIIVR